MTTPHEPDDLGRNLANPEPGALAAEEHARPVGRRHALRALLGGMAAAIGAALVAGRNPEGADAAPLSPSPSSNTAGTPAIMATGTNGANGVNASSDNGSGVLGLSDGGIGVEGSGAIGVYGEGGTGGSGLLTPPGVGVWGDSLEFTGVIGSTAGANASTYGVYGVNRGSSGTGVVGECDGGGTSVGVQGLASGGTGVSGGGNAKNGVYGDGSTIGVWGQTGGATGTGVEGDSFGTGPGVYGSSTGGGHGVHGSGTGSGARGVYGQGGEFGVFGDTAAVGVFGSGSEMGVWGQTNGSAAGVEGDNFGAGPGVIGDSQGGGYGVQGSSTGGTDTAVKVQNVGVYGQATGAAYGIGVLGVCSNDVNSVGLYGQSNTGKGFLGFSLSATGTGAVGVNTAGGTGLLGISQGGTGSGYGVVSSGACFVEGALTVTGPKSAAVRDTAGTLRRLYSMESPESWFEDFGSGQLSSGSATVELDPGFAAVIRADGYHVFPVAEGDCKGLYVMDKTPAGFAVRELQGGTSGVGFSYRIVAKRKDIVGARLEEVIEPPKAAIPEPIQPQPAPQPHH